MKVITGSKEWKTVVSCPEEHCAAVLEIEKDDLYVGNTAAFYAGETWEPHIFVTCAVCETEFIVTAAVPYGIRTKLIDKAKEEYERDRK